MRPGRSRICGISTARTPLSSNFGEGLASPAPTGPPEIGRIGTNGPSRPRIAWRSEAACPACFPGALAESAHGTGFSIASPADAEPTYLQTHPYEPAPWTAPMMTGLIAAAGLRTALEMRPPTHILHNTKSAYKVQDCGRVGIGAYGPDALARQRTCASPTSPDSERVPMRRDTALPTPTELPC